MRRLIGSVLVLGLAACGAEKTPGGEPARPPGGDVWVTDAQASSMGLELGKVREERIDDTLAVPGRVAFDDLRVAHVFSPVGGRVARIFAELGTRVKRGAPLATIASPDLGTASSEARRAAADLVAARHDFERKAELWKYRACSLAEYEAAEDAFRRAQAESERAEQKLALLGASSQDVTQGFTLRAPIDGEILARAVSPGLEVGGLYGATAPPELFTVGEIDRVWVWADVHELDLARVRVGAPATVGAVAYPDARFAGTVDLVSRALDPATHAARVRVSLANPDGLLMPDMYTRVTMTTRERRAVAVRRDAIVRLGDQSFVFAAAGATADGRRRFERRHVAVDDAAPGDWVPVEHGIAPGDEIVTHGAVLLSAVP